MAYIALSNNIVTGYKLNIGYSIMVRAWYMDSLPGDQRLPHRSEGSQEVSLDKLAELGVLYWKVQFTVPLIKSIYKFSWRCGY